MSTFCLIHGAYHGAWCWHEVTTELRARGHDVVAPDLPAHGVDTTPPTETTLSGYVEAVHEAIDGREGPVVLVGHSMAGMVITEFAERYPDAVERLVYLTAYLPADGESMVDQRVEGSLISRHFSVDEQRGVGTIDDDALEELFYADCSAEKIELARSLVRPEPLEPLSTPVDLSEARFGGVSRVYVTCRDDRAITFEQQREMVDDRGCDAVLSLEASHSPFLSVPTETAETLLAASKR